MTETWGDGTVESPKFRRAIDETHDDFRYSAKYYTFDTDEGLVAGATISLTCTIHRPAREVWPVFKDHTLWQDAYHHYYSGVVGDLEGKTFMLSTNPNEFDKHRYEVLKVIPEHLIIVHQPIPDDDFSLAPGHPQGGVSPGVMVSTLNEFDGETVINVFMEHRFRTQVLSEEDALAEFFWMPDALLKWRDVFIPALKMLVYKGDVPLDWKEKWRESFAEIEGQYAAVLNRSGNSDSGTD
jgi:hypothetical protein